MADGGSAQRGRYIAAPRLSLAGPIPKRRHRGAGRPQFGAWLLQASHWRGADQCAHSVAGTADEWAALEPKPVIVRYKRQRPGELIHFDSKKVDGRDRCFVPTCLY